MNYRFVLILGAVSLAVACNQTSLQATRPQVLGTLELNMGETLGVAKFHPMAKLTSQAVITESQIVIAPTGIATVLVESNAPRNFDYVSRDFTITNNTGAALNNLTLVALAKTGNLGGVGTETAIKSATLFNGTATSNATAALARPTHAMTSSSGNIVVDDATNKSRASFQAITSTEATTIKNDSNFVSQVTSGTVLEYGFVATDNAQTSRSIANGATGKFNVAMRFPKGTGAGTYNFVMTFVVATMPANRVTRSPEESTANANTRATAIANATDKVLIDDSIVNTTAGYTVQNNVKIGTSASQTLLKNPAKLVIARVSAGGSTAGSVYVSDFVEVFNAGEFSATFNGKSFQYGSLNGNFGTTTSALNVNTINVSSLGIVSPGTYKLVSTPNQANAAQPATPATETTAAWIAAFNFATGGKIAIVNQTASLDCGGNPAISPGVACDSTQSAKFIDLICYQRGNTSCTTSIAEGLPFDYTTITGDNVFSRAGKGCIDANNNKTDFAEEIITNTSARNSSTPAFICP